MKKIARITILNASESKVENKMLVHKVWDLLSYTVQTRPLGKIQELQKSFIHRGTGRFATGLVPIVKSKLQKKGYTVKIFEPERRTLEPGEDVPHTFVELDEYQSRAINKVNGHPRGLFISATGSGKTVMEAHLISYYGLPRTLIIVPSKPLLRQMRDNMKTYLSLHEVGVLGDGKRQIERVTVGLYQTLARYELDEINKLFDMVIVDEVQTSQCDSYQIIMNQLTNIYYRYGFTATMKIKQPDRYIIQGLFGKPIAIIPESETEGRVTGVKMHMIRFKDKFKDAYNYTERARANIWENRERNKLISEAIKFITEDKNMSCLVLTERMAQAESLNRELSLIGVHSPIIWNETAEDEKVRLLRQLDSKKLKCIIGTPAIAVGVDIPNLEFLFIVSEIKSWLPLVQRIGRGRRRTKGKDILYAADIFNSFIGDYRQTFKKQSFKKKKVYEKRGWLEGIYSLEKFKEKI